MEFVFRYVWQPSYIPNLVLKVLPSLHGLSKFDRSNLTLVLSVFVDLKEDIHTICEKGLTLSALVLWSLMQLYFRGRIE